MVSLIGLGLAALGRPAYITSGHEEDLPDRSVTGMRSRTCSMLDAACAARAQLAENLAALSVGQLPALSRAEAPDAYWAERAARPWH